MVYKTTNCLEPSYDQNREEVVVPALPDADRQRMASKAAVKPRRPTHFLSFPISDAHVQQRAQEAISVLLDARPRPAGIDESLAVHPSSLHLTLGIMALASASGDVNRTEDEPEVSTSESSEDKRKYLRRRTQTVEDAAKLLRECAPSLRRLLTTERIAVNFDRTQSFQSDASKCRVLYAEPAKASKGVATLHRLAGGSTVRMSRQRS